jgi:hypothetical protein
VPPASAVTGSVCRSNAADTERSMYFGWGEGNVVSALRTHTEQVGHRVRTITTGGRARRRATTAEIDNCVIYLEQVADDVEQYGYVVDSVAVDARKPMTGRIRIRRAADDSIPGATYEISLEWQHKFGWYTRTHSAGAPPEGWFHLYADDAATPETVTGFLLDGILPAELPRKKPDGPGRPSIAS